MARNKMMAADSNDNDITKLRKATEMGRVYVSQKGGVDTKRNEFVCINDFLTTSVIFRHNRNLVALNGTIKYQPSNTLVSSATVSTVNMWLVKAAVCVASGCSVVAIIAVLFTATSLYQEINNLHDEIVKDMNAFKVLYFHLYAFM